MELTYHELPYWTKQAVNWIETIVASNSTDKMQHIWSPLPTDIDDDYEAHNNAFNWREIPIDISVWFTHLKHFNVVSEQVFIEMAALTLGSKEDKQ